MTSAEATTAAYQHWGKGFVDDLYPFVEMRAKDKAVADSAYQHYIQVVKALDELVILEYDDHQNRCCERMSVIGRNDLFPYTWRIEAYRTFLPSQVSDVLEKWQSYIDAVRAGKYRDYLLQWYLYRESKRAVDFWRVMKETAQHILSSQDQVDKASSVPMIEMIFGLPQPEQYQPPVFEKTSMEDIDWQQDERYQHLVETFTDLHKMRHLWNQNMKKRAVKFHRGEYPFFDHEIAFDVFVSEAGDERLDDLFKWLNDCVNDGVGLYLWV